MPCSIVSVVFSERSGKTEDAIVPDVYVPLNGGIIKTGGIRGSERTSKYNWFMDMEGGMGNAAIYAGRNFSEVEQIHEYRKYNGKTEKIHGYLLVIRKA